MPGIKYEVTLAVERPNAGEHGDAGPGGRNNANDKTEWQFTAANARTKLKRLYPALQT